MYTSNWKYRQHVQNSANDITEANRQSAYAFSGRSPYIYAPSLYTEKHPILFSSIMAPSRPIVPASNSNAGMFLAKERAAAQQTSHRIPTSLFNFF
jgi:hypothetical protein